MPACAKAKPTAHSDFGSPGILAEEVWLSASASSAQHHRACTASINPARAAPRLIQLLNYREGYHNPTRSSPTNGVRWSRTVRLFLLAKGVVHRHRLYGGDCTFIHKGTPHIVSQVPLLVKCAHRMTIVPTPHHRVAGEGWLERRRGRTGPVWGLSKPLG